MGTQDPSAGARWSAARNGTTPTITDIAREVGVSVSAVSYALNGKAGVSADRRRRIAEVAEQLGYRPNSSAQALASSRARAFGLVINRPAEVVGSDPFFPAFMAGAQSVLSRSGYTLLLDILVDGGEQEHYERLVTSGQVSGFFLTDLLVEDPRLPFLAERGVPAVISGSEPVEGFEFPVVSFEEDDALIEAVDELVRLGHTRIATVSGPATMRHAMRRQSTVEQAVRAHGLELVGSVEGDFGAASGAAAMTRLLARKSRPTAVLFSNDRMAIAGCAIAQSMGYSIPGDIS
ncbi:MAG: LacI family DNA-binding transcriptional regulator, partial [Brachybacterium sp.]|nr:LacI family DNA-binding transcriptional regulator [Brachybacterium sp.]